MVALAAMAPSIRGVSSRAAKKAVRNKLNTTPLQVDFTRRGSPPRYRPGSAVNWDQHAGQLSALAGQSPGAILLSPVTVSGGNASAKSGVICSNRGIDHSFPSYRRARTLPEILVTVVYKDHMHPRLTLNGKKISQQLP